MKRRLFQLLAFIAFIGGSWYFLQTYSDPHILNARSMAPTTAESDGVISLKDLRSDYNASERSQGKVRILIVPGHEPTDGGARFRNLYERNLVVEIGQDLQKYLQASGNYQTVITRDTTAWNSIFTNYFANDWNRIVQWEKSAQKNTPKFISLGGSPTPPVDHISAATNVALRLYGITKWADENNIDLMIHLHLNDYPGHSSSIAGKYSGLVIYIPAQQYANGSTTKKIADAVFKRLSLYNPIDNLPVESSGIIDDPELIAVGANNTADPASMLIEYDYLYEPQFVNPAVRALALKDLAYQTYLGLQDFFAAHGRVTATSSYNPESLYAWKTPVTGNTSNPEDIYALQTALIMAGEYPPTGKTKNDCPHSGTFGTCTRTSLRQFQKKYNIGGEGVSGPKTFDLLQKIYGENS